MDQQEFWQRTKRVLDQARDVMQSILDADDDQVLNERFIDDGGEYMFKKQTSELDLLEDEMARLQAKRPILLARLEGAELALKASRLGASGLKGITVEMEPGRAAYTDSQGKQWPAQKPKLSSMQVRVGEEPRFAAHLVGSSQRDTPEYRNAVLARREASDNQLQISNLKVRIAKRKEEINEFLKLQASADSMRDRDRAA